MGVENLTESERHYKVLMAGVDQFGGNNDVIPVLEAFELGNEEHGRTWMRKRIEVSARRLLRNIFNTNLFENPYLEIEESKDVVVNPKYLEEGYLAQIKSVVMLKNKNNVLPIKERQKVYIPNRRKNDSFDWFGNKIDAHEINPVDELIVKRFYDLVDNPKDADFSIVFISSPESFGYTDELGYLPLSLQYRPYKAIHARTESLVKGASYKDKTNITANELDLDIILETKTIMKDKPIIAVANTLNPFVVAEFENEVDAILLHFNIQNQAIFELIKGNYEPSGLLPFQMPKDMKTVEEQLEDLAFDMECYIDSNNDKYDFGYGLNFKGVIKDNRTNKYKR